MTFSASAPQLPSYWKDWVSAALLEFSGTPTAPPTATKSAYKPVRVECAGGPSDTPPLSLSITIRSRSLSEIFSGMRESTQQQIWTTGVGGMAQKSGGMGSAVLHFMLSRRKSVQYTTPPSNTLNPLLDPPTKCI